MTHNREVIGREERQSKAHVASLEDTGAALYILLKYLQYNLLHQGQYQSEERQPRRDSCYPKNLLPIFSPVFNPSAFVQTS